MTGLDLVSKKCVSDKKIAHLSSILIEKYLNLLTCRWEVIDGIKIRHEFRFDNFEGSMKFANSVAKLAQKQNHHPNIHIYYNRVIIDLSTHSVHGLSENDFVMAAKIEEL